MLLFNKLRKLLKSYRPPPFFVLKFGFHVIHESGRVAKKKKKNQESVGTFIMWMMSGGCEVDVGGGVHIQITH